MVRRSRRCSPHRLAERAQGMSIGQAMKDAYEKRRRSLWTSRRLQTNVVERPVFSAVVALGILVILALWAIEALGFGELGPIKGMYICAGVYYAEVLFACRNLSLLGGSRDMQVMCRRDHCSHSSSDWECWEWYGGCNRSHLHSPEIS
jgi:hypothetical protein